MNTGKHNATTTDAVPIQEENRDPVGTTAPEEPLHEFLREVSLLTPANVKHAEFINVQKRYDSFTNWTHHQGQSPKSLAEAGFFFTGEEDRVRCFVCDGVLANWDKHDIPWYEHYKWFGNCLYVTQCSKHEVVNAIIETAKTIHGRNSVNPHPRHHHEGTTQCD